MIFLKDLGANFGYHSSRRYSISGLLRQNGHLLDINNCRKIITVLKVSARLIRKIQMPARYLKLESVGGCLYCSVSDVIKFPPIFNHLDLSFCPSVFLTAWTSQVFLRLCQSWRVITVLKLIV